MVIICGAVILCISIQILKQLLFLANLSESSKERVVDRHGALKNKEMMMARIGPSDELFFYKWVIPGLFFVHLQSFQTYNTISYKFM